MQWHIKSFGRIVLGWDWQTISQQLYGDRYRFFESEFQYYLVLISPLNVKHSNIASYTATEIQLKCTWLKSAWNMTSASAHFQHKQNNSLTEAYQYFINTNFIRFPIQCKLKHLQNYVIEITSMHEKWEMGKLHMCVLVCGMKINDFDCYYKLINKKLSQIDLAVKYFVWQMLTRAKHVLEAGILIHFGAVHSTEN